MHILRLRLRTQALALATAAPLLLALAGTGSAAAQQMPPVVTGDIPQTTLLTVSAEGEVKIAPDMAEVRSGVVTQAATAGDALAQNRTRMERAVQAITDSGIPKKDIQTSNLTLNPEYRYEDGQQPQITGYRAENQVRITMRSLEDAGRVLDALVAVGANQLSGPDFMVEDREDALNAARQDAVQKARARAELYAAAAGMSVGRIVSIVEAGASTPPPPMPMMAMRAEAADASSPVEPGEVTLTSGVTVVFELR